MYPEFGDRRENVSSARTYFYTDEAKCDQNLQTLLQCVDAAGKKSNITVTMTTILCFVFNLFLA